jgi:hypothetical protein
MQLVYLRGDGLVVLNQPQVRQCGQWFTGHIGGHIHTSRRGDERLTHLLGPQLPILTSGHEFCGCTRWLKPANLQVLFSESLIEASIAHPTIQAFEVDVSISRWLQLNLR